MATVCVYSFEAKIASRGYHVDKETSWSKAWDREEVKGELERSESSKNVDPYACFIRAKEEYFKGWKKIGHNPRELSRHTYYFIKTEGSCVNGTVMSVRLQYQLVD